MARFLKSAPGGLGRRRFAVAMAVSLVAVTLAACGSGSGSGEGSGVSVNDMAKLENIVDEKLKGATSIGIDEPLEKLPTGAKVAAVYPNVPVIDIRMKALSEAMGTMGAEVTRIPYGAGPTEFANAFDRLLTEDYDGVVTTDLEARSYQKVFDSLKERHIPVVEVAVPNDQTEDNLMVVMPSQQIAAWNREMVDYLLVESKGDANVLFTNFPEFEGLALTFDAMKDEMDKYCERCELQSINLKSSDVGANVPGAIVAHLQSNPEINYVYLAFGDAGSGLPAALKNAGLDTKVKIVSNSGGAQNWQAIREGTQVADITFSNTLLGWQNADALARAITGQDTTVSTEWQMPTQILTKDNLDFTGEYEGVPAFKEQFKRLWKTS